MTEGQCSGPSGWDRCGESSPWTQASGSRSRHKGARTRKPRRLGGGAWPGKSTSRAERGRAAAWACCPPTRLPAAPTRCTVAACADVRASEAPRGPSDQPQWFPRLAAESPDHHTPLRLPVPQTVPHPVPGHRNAVHREGSCPPKAVARRQVGAEAPSRWPGVTVGCDLTVCQASANPRGDTNP